MKKHINTIIIIILSVLSLTGFALAVKYANEIKVLNHKVSHLNTKISDMRYANREQSKDDTSAKAKADKIDAEIQKCMQACGYTTVCMSECVYKAGDKWTQEIDRNIKLLENMMNTEQTELLRNSQKEWNEYKDAQQKLNDKTIGAKDGTMYRNILSGEQVDIIEKRAKELQNLYSIFSEQ